MYNMYQISNVIETFGVLSQRYSLHVVYIYSRFIVYLIKIYINILINFSESAVGPLIENLNRLWTTFQTSISSDLSDYLSVEHLAIILQQISKKGKMCLCKCVISIVAACIYNMMLLYLICLKYLRHVIV